jgi:hypothetical protein
MAAILLLPVKLMAAILLLPVKFQERDLNNNPKNSGDLFCTFLTGTKKIFSYYTARYTRTHAHTCTHIRARTRTQNSSRIMNVSTKVKDQAVSKLFRLLWVVYASPCGVILNGPAFITYVPKS